MKKHFFFIFFTIATSISFANEPVDLDIDIQAEFQKLDEIEAYVISNDVSLEELKASGKSDLLLDVNLDSSNAVIVGDYESTLGIPPFLWGCVLGVIGILFVFILTDKDKDATKRAMFGCIAIYGTVSLAYLVYIIVVLAVVSSY